MGRLILRTLVSVLFGGSGVRGDALVLFAGKIGRDFGALGGVVGAQVAQRPLEGVITRNGWGQVDAEAAGDRLVELLPLVGVGPALIARCALALVVDIVARLFGPFPLSLSLSLSGAEIGLVVDDNGRERRSACEQEPNAHETEKLRLHNDDMGEEILTKECPRCGKPEQDSEDPPARARRGGGGGGLLLL